MKYEEQIKQILEESKADILEQTKAALKSKIISSIDWQLGTEISSIVKKTIEESLADEIQQAVLECKQEIIKSIAPIFSTVGAVLAKAMQEKVVKVMNDSWKADKIIKSLFE